MVEIAAANAATHIKRKSDMKTKLCMACASLVDVNILAYIERLVN